MSVKDEETAIRLIEELPRLLAKGGFKLSKWSSNSKRVIETIPEEARAKGWKDIQDLDDKVDGPMEYALGTRYNVMKDTLSAEVWQPRLDGPAPRTKRAVCSLVMSFFDPLGHFAPFALTGRLLLQKLTKLKL